MEATMEDSIDSFRLDHLGLPAQMAVDISFVEAIDALLGVDVRLGGTATGHLGLYATTRIASCGRFLISLF
jgi:hypothetical protein